MIIYQCFFNLHDCTFKRVKKAGWKLSVLTRLCKFTSLRRWRILMKYFMESQFAYCHLVRMCCKSSFEKLVWKDNSAIIYVRNPRILESELCKTKENLAASRKYEIFKQTDIQYHLLSQTAFQLGSVKRINYGLRALRYLAPKIWNVVPLKIKHSKTQLQYKIKIKFYKPRSCPCNLCQLYFHCIRYIYKVNFRCICQFSLLICLYVCFLGVNI